MNITTMTAEEFLAEKKVIINRIERARGRYDWKAYYTHFKTLTDLEFSYKSKEYSGRDTTRID